MSGQHWRKALWHLRNGGFKGLKQYSQRARTETQPTERKSDTTLSAQDIPILSIVVPAFNAEDFIDRCLRSVLDQENTLLEVIVIDDGSNDETAESAREISHVDNRVSVITIANSGPAAARNRGIEAATGKYLSFVDADDRVLPDAYSTMIDSLERTGSDIATGSYLRIGSTGRTRPKVTARVHARQRLAVRLDDMPELLEEPVLWNKVYRREFWNRHVGEMTSFANYEDQEPVYRALVGAAAIDVLTKDVYAWRLADGRETRSRRKAKLTDLNAKLEVIEVLARTLVHESERVQEHAYAIWVGTDLAMHAEYLDTASKRFRTTLCTVTHDLKKAMPRGAWKLIPAQRRLLMWVVATGRLDDIEEILGTWAEETRSVPLEHIDGRWTVAPTYIARLETRLPSRLLKAQAIDFRPVAIVRNARWIGERKIELQGCAYIPGVDPADLTVRFHGVMDGATVFDRPVERRDDNRIDLDLDDPWRSYEAGGFRARVDISKIENLSPRGINLFASFEADGIHLLTPATSTTVVGMTSPSPLAGNARTTIVANEHDELSISPVELPSIPIIAKSVAMRGDLVTVTLSCTPRVRKLELVHHDVIIPLTLDGSSNFSGTLPTMPDRYKTGGERTWCARGQLADGSIGDVYHDEIDYLLPDTGRIRPEPNKEGIVRISQRLQRVSVTGASSDRDRLVITGRIDPPEKLSVLLKSSSQTIEPGVFSLHGDGSFTAVYDLTTFGPEGGRVAALSGGYHVRYGATSETANSWARVAGKLAIRAVDCFTEWNTLRIEGRISGAVAITASPPWSPRERTKYGRFILRGSHWGPTQTGILFESYNGKSTNDNPRALFEAALKIRQDIPLYWSVQDRTVEVPVGGVPVVEGTADWHRVLATTKVWVNNNNFPYYVRKRSDQFYLQTWHGTPIKKLLWDIPRKQVPITYRRLMKSEVPQWDLMLAQSEQAGERLKSGLGYDGPVRIMEYPRNNRLYTAIEQTIEIREKLNIHPSDNVILYAPTWRDHRKWDFNVKGGAFLDPIALAASTDSIVLVRAHHMVSPGVPQGSNVKDVSFYPQVEELMAISDHLVTDYSSIAYDFAVTGRPVTLYINDFKEYSTSRGLYSHPADLPFEYTDDANVLADIIKTGKSERCNRRSRYDLSETAKLAAELTEAASLCTDRTSDE